MLLGVIICHIDHKSSTAQGFIKALSVWCCMMLSKSMTGKSLNKGQHQILISDIQIYSKSQTLDNLKVDL